MTKKKKFKVLSSVRNVIKIIQKCYTRLVRHPNHNYQGFFLPNTCGWQCASRLNNMPYNFNLNKGH